MGEQTFRRPINVPYITLGSSHVQIRVVAGAPTDGTSGTGAGTAEIGSLVLDSTNGRIYQNVGTKASPSWEPAVGADAGVLEARTEGGALNTGTLVYISGWSETQNKFLLTKADADASGRRATFVTLAAIANNANGLVGRAYRGTVNGAGDAALDLAAAAVGDPVYLSITAGQATLAAPSGADAQVQIVGQVAVVATDLVEVLLREPHIVGLNEIAADAVRASELGVTAGTATASRALVPDASLDLTGVRHLTTTGNARRSSASPAAAGNSAATATALTADLNLVTAADGTKGVILPVGVAGDAITVVNTVVTVAAILKVYPDTGGQINAGGVDTAVNLGPGAVATFVCTAALTWQVDKNAAILNNAEIALLTGATAASITASKVVTRDAGLRVPFATASPAAAGNSAATATAITADVNLVTAADGTTGVILPVGVAGMRIEVVNTVTTVAALLKVYPDTGGAINGGGVDASVNVGPGTQATFVCTAALTWQVEKTAAILNYAEVALLTGATAASVTASKVVTRDAASKVPLQTATAVAAGAAQATATALTAQVNAVTGADGAKGVALPAAGVDTLVVIVNVDASALLVYPVNGGDDQINALGANNAYTLPASSTGFFFGTSATQWYGVLEATGITSAMIVDGTIVNADIGAAAAIARSKLAEDALQVHDVDVLSDAGAALLAAETAGSFNRSVAANVALVQGEITDNETEASVGTAQFRLPASYVAAGDITLRLRCAIVKTGAAVDNASTIDAEAYKSDGSGAVGADIVATAAQTFAAVDTWYSKDFTVTAAGLAAGDLLNLKITATIVDSEAGAGTLRFNMERPQLLLDVKG